MAPWAVLLRLSLLAFPRSLARRFGREMEEDFLHGLRSRGGVERMRWGVTTLWGVVHEGVSERLRPVPPSERRARDQMKGGGTMGWRKGIRFAWRGLRRRPAYAAVAAVTIALGVGANTAIFSLIHAVLLTPLDYPRPDELVVIGEQTGIPGELNTISSPETYALAQLPALERIAAYRTSRLTVTGSGPAETVVGAMVTDGVLSILGVTPHLGRDLRPEEGRDPSASRVVVLGYDFWRSRMSGDPRAVGESIVLDGVPYEIVGVAPEDVDFPGTVELWAPGGTLEGDCYWGCNLFRGIGRLGEGGSLDALREQALALSSRLEEERPRQQTERRFEVVDLQEYQVGRVEDGLWILLGAVVVVLLIACANVANLMLARSQDRQPEMAVRTALGASRLDLFLGVMWESLLLASVGGIMGVGLAAGILEMLPSLASEAVPRLEDVRLSLPVLGFSASVVIASALGFGLLPAFQVARQGGGGRSPMVGRRSVTGGPGRLRSGLLGGEVALSLVLLVGAGLLLRTFASLVRVDPGYVIEDVIRFDVSLPEAVYDEPAEVRAFVIELEERMAQLPGVETVAVGTGTHLTAYGIGGGVRLLDRPEPEPGEGPSAAVRVVTPTYFELQEIAVVRGTTFDGTERHGEPSAFVVNEAFVDAYLSDRDEPVGTPVRSGIAFGFDREPGEIIGVVEDVRPFGLRSEPSPEIYFAHAQYPPTFFTVSIRLTEGAPSPAGIRDALAAVDPDVPLFRLGTIEEAVEEELAASRFYLALLSAFAALAVILAAIGVYGVVAYAVGRRTREIGLRIALGASEHGILRLVLGEGMRPAVLGIVAGVAGAAGTVRLLESLLYGVRPLDPVTFLGVVVLLLAVSALAIAMPARKATRLHPVEALRTE